MELSEVGVAKMDALIRAQEYRQTLAERLAEPLSDTERASTQARLKAANDKVTKMLVRIQA